MKMQKILALLLAAMTLMTALASCKTAPASSDDPSSTETVVTTPVVEDFEPNPALAISGTPIGDYVIVAATSASEVASKLQAALAYATGGQTLDVVHSSESDKQIVLEVDSSLAAGEWKVSCEGGRLALSGEDLEALKTGYMTFVGKYALSVDAPEIKDGIAESGVANEGNLVSLNLPTSYGALPTQSDTYNADTIWANFEEARAELPDEVTVLDHFRPEDYPASMAFQVVVSLDGDDNNPGTVSAPVATVKKALSLLAERGACGGVIWMRGGAYNEHVVLTAEQSGTANSPLFLGAYPNEEVEWNGYYAIAGSDFSAVTEDDPLYDRIAEDSRDKILVADLTSLGIDVENIVKMSSSAQPVVYADGKKQTLARYPNNGAMTKELEYLDETGRTTSTRPITLVFNKSDIDLSKCEFTNDMWIYGSLFYEWTYNAWRISKIDAERNAIICYNYDMWDRHEEWRQWRPNNELYFYNFIELLDVEKEWYLDRTTGRFYYYPEKTFTAASEVRLLGEDRKGTVEMTETSNIVFFDLFFNEASNYGIMGTNCHDIVADHCVFTRLTSRVGFFMNGGIRCGVIYSEFIDSCPYIMGSRTNLVPTNNFFQNNYIHGITSSMGVGITNCVGDVYSHNRMENIGFTVNPSNECIIEYNDLSGGRYDKTDTGYIYCVGADLTGRGNHIRYNYFHDMGTNYTGLYFDVRASGFYVYGNIVEGDPDNPQMRVIASSGDNVIYNNILAKGRYGVLGNMFEWVGNQTATDVTWLASYITIPESRSEAYRVRYQQYYRFVDLLKGLQASAVDGKVPMSEEVELTWVGGYQWIKNNVIIDCNVPLHNDDRHYIENYIPAYETNFITNDGSIFADYENGDYRLVENSAIYTEIPDWEELPYDKMGIQHTCGEDLTKIEAKAATCVADGNNEYYLCPCGKCYLDAEAKDETTIEAQTLASTGEHDKTYSHCTGCGEPMIGGAGIKKATPVLDGVMDELYFDGGSYKFYDMIYGDAVSANSYIYLLHDDENLYIYGKFFDKTPFKRPAGAASVVNGYNYTSFLIGINNLSLYVGPGFPTPAASLGLDVSKIGYCLEVNEDEGYYEIELCLPKSEFGVTGDKLTLTKLGCFAVVGSASRDWYGWDLLSEEAGA